jgi:hypothetical protein
MVGEEFWKPSGPVESKKFQPGSKSKTMLFLSSRSNGSTFGSNKNRETKLSSNKLSLLAMVTLTFVGWFAVLFIFGFPALDEGLYLQSVPQVRHLAHIGLDLLHLTFARKHPSHEARSRGMRGLPAIFVEDILLGSCV